MSEPRPHPVAITSIRVRPLPVATWTLFTALLLMTVLQFNQRLEVDQWEYKIASVPDESFQVGLDQLGVAGWELVSARRAADEPLNEKSKFRYEMIFKRRKAWIPRPTPQYIPE